MPTLLEVQAAMHCSLVAGDDAAMTAGTQAFDQSVARDARNRLFARRIDIGDDHRARVVHAGAEIVEQRVQP